MLNSGSGNGNSWLKDATKHVCMRSERQSEQREGKKNTCIKGRYEGLINTRPPPQSTCTSFLTLMRPDRHGRHPPPLAEIPRTKIAGKNPGDTCILTRALNSTGTRPEEHGEDRAGPAFSLVARFTPSKTSKEAAGYGISPRAVLQRKMANALHWWKG